MLKRIFSKTFFFEKKDEFLFSTLGYNTANDLYRQALVHKSSNQKKHNERLEFLGDAVLSSIIAEFLFLEHPRQNEGFLSKKRSVLISRKHLNIIGRKLIPKEKIISNLTSPPPNVFGNTLEAIIGAIYIDKGLEAAKTFVRQRVYNSEDLESLLEIDFKSKLLKYSQKEKIKIEYRVEKEYNKKNKAEICVVILANGQKITKAIARSKKEAEQEAAKKAINKLFGYQ